MRPRLLVGLALFVAAFAGDSAQGANETPSSKLAFQFHPVEFEFGYSGAQVFNTLVLQGYNVSNCQQSTASTAPTFGLYTYTNGLASGNGVIFTNTHGAANDSVTQFGLVVEGFAATPEGLQARDDSLDSYADATGWGHYYGGEGGGLFDADSESPPYYHYICVRPQNIAEVFSSSKTLVYNACCYGSRLADGYPGARCLLGYPDLVYVSTTASDADHVFQSLDGDDGIESRSVQAARTGALQIVGQGATALAPVVSDVQPPPGSTIGDPDGESGTVTFDCLMNKNIDPKKILSCSNEGGSILVQNATWSPLGDAITCKFLPVITGLCSLRVDTSAVSAGGMVLDGNTNPYWANGRGPNRDPYVVALRSGWTNPTYEARFDQCYAFAGDDSRTHIVWVTDPEQGSAAFRLLAGEGLTRVAATVPAAGSPTQPHYYEVSLPPGDTLFGIVEVPKDPSRPATSSRPFRLSAPPKHLAGLRTTNDMCASWLSPPIYGAGRSLVHRPSATYSNFVFYSSRQDFLDATAAVREKLLQKYGFTSQCVLGSSDPLEAKAAFQAVYETAIAEGRPLLPIGVIVGECSTDAAHNIVGTIYVEDGYGGGVWSPYASDPSIVDFDGDELPDMPWTRIDGTTVTDIANSCYGYIDVLYGMFLSAPRVLCLDGNTIGINCIQEAEPTQTLADITARYQANGVPTVTLHDSDWSCWDYAGRLAAADAVIDGQGVSEIIGIGQNTNHNVLPGYFIQKATDPMYDGTQFTRRQRVICEFPTCGDGDIDRYSTWWPSVATLMMTANPELYTTAVCWLSHMRGGYEAAHLTFAPMYFEERWKPTALSTHHAFWNAIRRCGTEEPGLRDYLRMEGAFGWPVFFSAMTSVEIEQSMPRSVSLTAAPNPFNPETIIRYSLTGVTRVALSVYDVNGRLVRKLVPIQAQEGGEHAVSWDGRNDQGKAVASGTYFARLELNGTRTLVNKLVLLK